MNLGPSAEKKGGSSKKCQPSCMGSSRYGYVMRGRGVLLLPLHLAGCGFVIESFGWLLVIYELDNSITGYILSDSNKSINSASITNLTDRVRYPVSHTHCVKVVLSSSSPSDMQPTLVVANA